jgi:hypothetical protein
MVAEQADWAESTSGLDCWLARVVTGLLREIERVRRPAAVVVLRGLLGWKVG